MLTLQSETTAI